MIIRKFKNRKIKLQLQRYDIQNGEVNENVYHDDMFMKDLYISQIETSQYIVDYNTRTVYRLGSYLLQNPLKYLLDELKEHNHIYLYPMGRKDSKELLDATEQEDKL